MVFGSQEGERLYLLFIIFVYKKWRQKIIYTTERGFPSEGEKQKETKKNQKRTLGRKCIPQKKEKQTVL